jgi:Xaa-Pro aminopeptidase
VDARRFARKDPSKCPQLEFVDISSLFAGLRAVKDKDEIELIRGTLRLCDLGQELVKNLAYPDMNEIELFGEIRKPMETKAGTRLAFLADLVSAPRTAQISGHPTSRRFLPGDLIISDLVPRFRGYWGGICNSCAVGETQKVQRETFAGINAILQEAIERVRPGVRASDLDAFVRQRTTKLFGLCYPHHT